MYLDSFKTELENASKPIFYTAAGLEDITYINAMAAAAVGGEELGGHSLGNLILVALAEHMGFALAYVLASSTVVAINTLYLAAIMRRRTQSALIVVGLMLATLKAEHKETDASRGYPW